MIDYHLHTKLCKHASGEVSEYVEKSIRAGLNEIAFTDHIPLPKNFDAKHRMKLFELEVYRRCIEDARDKYPEIKIRFGIEADYYSGFEEYLFRILNEFNFDLVIMSIHFIRHWPKNNWVFNYNLSGMLINEIYDDYLNEMIKGIQTGLYDVIGHADIIKGYGDSLIKLVPNKVKKMLYEAKNYGMVIEYNTSGYRKKVLECYPGFDWLPFIQEVGLPITIGSDAHSPEQVALNYLYVYDKLQRFGIKEIATFEKRKIKLSYLLS
jgi:histidinol-phosphatase (PHP family)